MYRFVVGGFGVVLPHPYKTTLCGPFWLMLAGCTVGLPAVLFAWTIRLIFGRGRAARLGNAVESFFETSRGRAFGKILLIIVLAGLAISLIVDLIYKYGWFNVVLGFLAVVGVFALAVGVGIGARIMVEHLPYSPKKGSETRARKTSAWKILAKILLFVPKIIILAAWQILCFIGLIIVAMYKKFCPIVEFP